MGRLLDMLRNLSPEGVQTLYNRSYYVLIGSLVIGAIATFVGAAATGISFWAGNKISGDLTRQLASALVEAGKANAQAGVANERAAVLEERTVGLQSANAQLGIQLEKERENRLRLQAALSSRHITPEQSSKIAAGVRGQLQKVVIEFTGDAETVAFAQDLALALKAGGVQVVPRGSGMMIPRPYGLILTVGDTANVLAKVLGESGIAFRLQILPGAIPSILVGEKPSPF